MPSAPCPCPMDCRLGDFQKETEIKQQQHWYMILETTTNLVFVYFMLLPQQCIYLLLHTNISTSYMVCRQHLMLQLL
jgi:hypothetical protein